jgi:S1-C subfamily serine protease
LGSSCTAIKAIDCENFPKWAQIRSCIMAAAVAFIWYWDNDGVWTPYGDEHQEIIEAAYIAGEAQAQLPIGGGVYIIDFHMDVQVSPLGNRRLVSRKATNNHNAGEHYQVVPDLENTLWFWRDDDGITWKPYETGLSQRLTQARLEGDTEVYLEIRDDLYRVDFTRNLQINMATNHPRDIRQSELYKRVLFLGRNRTRATSASLAQQMTDAAGGMVNYDTAAPDANLHEWHPSSRPEFNIRVWDFVGSGALHTYHSIFFNPQTLFVIVWQLEDVSVGGGSAEEALEKDIREKVQFWVDLVEERVPNAAIILPIALTLDAHNDGNNMLELEVRRRYEQLRRHLVSRGSTIKFCDGAENPLVHVKLSSSPSSSVGLDTLQEAVLASLIENAMPLAKTDVILRDSIKAQRESGVKIAELDCLHGDRTALLTLSNRGDILFFPTMSEPFAQWVVLDVPWFYRVGWGILRYNWRSLVGDGRRRQGRGDPPLFAGAMDENCPVVYMGDVCMLLQSSVPYSEAHNNQNNKRVLHYLPALLIHFGVLVPIEESPVKPNSSSIQTTTEPSYMPSLGIINPGGTFINANLFFIPSLLGNSVEADNSLPEYRDASASSAVFVAQKVVFQDGMPSSLIGSITGNLLRNILRRTKAKNGHLLNVKKVYCWDTIFQIKFLLITKDNQQTVLEVCSQVVESSDGGQGVKSYLFTSANELKGDGGRYIWQAGFGLVCDTIRLVLSSYRNLVCTREAFCHRCFVANGIRATPPWRWSELETALKSDPTCLRCPMGHALLASQSDQQEFSLRRAVVLIGLYDKSAPKGRIRRLGSGVVVDASRGLIVTAARNIMTAEEGNDQFGRNYDGIVGGKIVVGVIPETGGEAVFRYFAKIRATALAASRICHVDACALQILSSFENDVEGNGDDCDDQFETLLRGRVSGLVQLPTEEKWEVEDPVRIFGYGQRDPNAVNRRLSDVGGLICQYREEEPSAGQQNAFQPLKSVVVRTATDPGFSGGPCINEAGKVIGILSCADPDESSRSCVVPFAEWQSLLQTVL